MGVVRTVPGRYKIQFYRIENLVIDKTIEIIESQEGRKLPALSELFNST